MPLRWVSWRVGSVPSPGHGSVVGVSVGHAHELPAGEPAGVVADALAEVEAGRIAYLTRAGEPVAALVPVTELTELQQASQAAAIADAQAVRARPGPHIPHEVIEAMMAADDATHDAMAAALDAHAGQDLPPDEVTAIWKMITGRRSA
jgi:antitoxin (DNA-binding transcriptional repressor) of toxin-antitoxin stability system